MSTKVTETECLVSSKLEICKSSVLYVRFTEIDLAHLDESRLLVLPRKEVIHPHVPVRIPCYDLTPIIPPTLGLRRGNTSGIGDFHGLTGGVYKTRERIHRSLLICDY